MFEHILRNAYDAGDGRGARFCWSFLEACFDCVDGRIREWSHGSTDQAYEHGLITGKF